MAFSGSNSRSTSQDSPVLWLSLLAGSLALHLALLLLGRWYLSQAANISAGSPPPLDFIEIDPNAPPLKDAKPIAPSTTPDQNTAVQKSAPPQTAEQSQQPSIENPPRQAEPPRQTEKPQSSPIAPEKPRSQAGQLPTDSTPKRNPSVPTPPTPGTTKPSTSPTQPQQGTPSTPTGETPGNPAGRTPSTPTGETPGNSTGSPANKTPGSPAGSGEGLSIATGVRGEVRGSLQEDNYRPEQYARGSVTLKSASLPSISFDYPTKLPVKVLDLRLGLLIGADGAVTATVREDSPTLKTYPNIENDVKSIVDQLIPAALADKSLAFNINLESSKVDAYRIMDIRIYVSQ